MARLNKEQTKQLQRELNHFTNKYLLYYTPLIVDGDFGTWTKRRIRHVKFYLGYGAKKRDSSVYHQFRVRLRHPKHPRWTAPHQLALAGKRRVEQRRKAKKNHVAAGKTSGVGWLDNRPVANWLIPYAQWARTHEVKGRKWVGSIASGFRDPAYSEHLCVIMCGRPTCSGRCAGRGSAHSQSTLPHGCIDVTDYWHFAEAMRVCPLKPRIFNDLPIDRVHFSSNGH